MSWPLANCDSHFPFKLTVLTGVTQGMDIGLNPGHYSPLVTLHIQGRHLTQIGPETSAQEVRDYQLNKKVRPLLLAADLTAGGRENLPERGREREAR